MGKTGKKETRGRRTLYKAEMCDLVERLAMLGLKDTEIAHTLKITERTLNRWKHDHPDFCQSLKDGREEADGMVARALFHRAIGYSHPEDKIFISNGKPIIVPTIKHYPPDSVAAIFWLKNRRPDKWMDKPISEPTGEEEAEFEKALKASAAKLWEDTPPVEQEADE